MFCAISGVAPKNAVVDKNGSLYEKTLIEAYIEEHGRDPIKGETLTKEDLLQLSGSPFVKPRNPAETSIPNCLVTLQNEWDAVMIELFEYKKRNFELQKQLTNALYEADAAKRVIARLLSERDEARKQLSEYDAGRNLYKPPTGQDDVEMTAEVSGLPADIIKVIESTHEEY